MTKVRKKIGTIPINDIEQQVQQSTSAAITQMQQDVSDFIDEETAQYPEIGGAFKFQEDPEGRSEITTDSEGKILSYRDSDGVKHENVGIETNVLKANSINFTNKNIEDIRKGICYDSILPVVDVISDNLIVNGNDIIGLDITKNKVNCTVTITTKEVCFTDTGTIAYQGNSTLSHPKKGFAFKFSSKHRFEEWLPMKSFHCKGYYNDILHLNDWLANVMIEQVYNARPMTSRRPFMLYNDFQAAEGFETWVEDGTLCHVDEFPVELYINGTYWGLYSLRLTKNNDNYRLTEKNKNHIQIEAANDTNYTVENFADGGDGWANIEIRNPSKDSGNSKFEEGVEPNNGEVKVSWRSFLSKINAITSNTTVQELSEFLNIQEWIDAILLYQLFNTNDIWAKNTLYTCWDSIANIENNTATGHWSPLLYDFDLAWNGGSNNPFESKAYPKCPWLSTLETILSDRLNERYAELRNKKIFDLDNLRSQISKRTKEIGYASYEKEFKRWPFYKDGQYIRSRSTLSWLMTCISQRLSYMDNRYNYNQN